MNMTKTFKKVGVLAIVLLMIAALVGCGGNQEEKQWEEDVTAIMNDITLSQTDLIRRWRASSRGTLTPRRRCSMRLTPWKRISTR